MYLWYQNFLFTRSQEYVVCDYTCLLGELGGGLGFFLGWSLLSAYEYILDKVFKAV